MKSKLKSEIIALVCILNRSAASTVSSKVAWSLLLTNFVIFLCFILYFCLNLFTQALLAEKIKLSDKNGKAVAIAHCCRVLVVIWKSMYGNTLLKLQFLKSTILQIFCIFYLFKTHSCFFKSFESFHFNMSPFIDICSSSFYILFPLF